MCLPGLRAASGFYVLVLKKINKAMQEAVNLV